MDVIIVLIGAALLVAGGFLIAFLWAVRSGQYDDLYTPSVRVLHDDASPESSAEAPGDDPEEKQDNNHYSSSENA